MKLNEQQTDTLTELVNISFSKAANSLSELTQQRVFLTVPKVKVVALEKLSEDLIGSNNEEKAAVSQLFKSEISGNSILLFDTKSSLILNDLLTDQAPGTTAIIDSSTKEVLIEVGNILLNNCMGILGDMLKVQFSFSVPTLKLCTVDNLMQDIIVDSKEECALLISMRFSLKQSNIDGYIIIILNVETMNSFIAKIEDLINF